MSDPATLPPADALEPALDMAKARTVRWPGESDAYRQARAALLA